MDFNGIKYSKLSYLDQFYDNPIDGIPKEGGIYYWVYWPDFDPDKISLGDLETKLKEYTSKGLFFTETVKGVYKFHAVISEQGYPLNKNTVFGLSPSKHQKLMNYLTIPVNLTFFAEFFKEVCFARPFYIGKADNLRSRLVTQHFRSATEILPEIRKSGIPSTEIWVGYKTIQDVSGDGINNILEEIFSRKIKPGLTKKSN